MNASLLKIKWVKSSNAQQFQLTDSQMKNNTVYYFTSKNFSDTNIIYGFFTRNGGKSKKLFDSLNCSFSSKDDKKNVTKNISVAKKNQVLNKQRLSL